MSEWNITFKPFSELLSNVVDNRGKTCPTAPSGLALIATNCIKNDNLYPVYENVRYVSDETYKSWFRGHPLPGDLILVTKGTPGCVCLVPSKVDFCIAQDMVAIRADNKKVNPKYLFAALRSAGIQSEIENLHVGSLIPHFKKGDFDKLQIPLPERELQGYIGEQYFAFSAKIDLLHRQNKTLEGMAEALWRQMFVEEADKGWRKGKLGDVVKIIYGKNLPTSALTESGYPVFGANGQIGYYKEYLYGKPQVLISCRGEASGKVNFSCGFSFVTNNSLVLEIPINSILKYEFLKYWALASDFTLYVTGSAQPQITIEELKMAVFDMPSEEAISQFSAIVAIYEGKRSHNNKQIENLVKLRNTLLPKLMSGEVRVKL